MTLDGMLALPAHVDAGTVGLLLLGALAAGWVDAVAGGGGLIQLPALLIGLGPGTPAVVSLATNKLASICGTATSSVTYYRRVRPDLRTALPMAACALVGRCSEPPSRRACPRGGSGRSCWSP